MRLPRLPSRTPGYELKGKVAAAAMLGEPADGLGGMHTVDDAHLYVRGQVLRSGPHELCDLAPTIAELLGVGPDGFQGTSVLAPAAATAGR